MSLALVINAGQVERVGATVSPEPLLVRGGAGAGIDLDAAATLEIGVTTASAITIGSGGAGGVLTTVAGDLSVTGNETVVGTTTFEGDTVIGDDTGDTLDVLASIINNGQPDNESLRFLAGSHKMFVAQSAATVIGGNLVIESGEGGDSNGASGGNGGQLAITAGAGGAGSGTQVGGQGGPLFIRAGASGADGGAGTQAAGVLTLEGGDSTADGGDVNIRGGDSSAGTAGDVNVLGGDGVVDGFVRIGTSQTNAVFVGSPTTTNDIAATVSHAEVAGSAGNASVTLNLTGAATAGSYAIGCYDDPAWLHINPSNDSLQGMLDAVDAALAAGGGTSLQEAYDNGRTIGIGSVTETQPVAITNSTNANGGLTISQTFAGGGAALGITMGASSTGDGALITMTTGAAGDALRVTDATEEIRLNLTGITNSQATTYATDDNVTANANGFQITMQPGAGGAGGGGSPGGVGGNNNVNGGTGGAGGAGAGEFGGNGGQTLLNGGTGGAGGGVGSGSGGTSQMLGGTGAAADATFAGSGGAATARAGTGGAATGAVAGGAGGIVTVDGGTGGAGTATGTAGAGGNAIITAGDAGADGGGGGANGGNVTINAGLATGAGTNGTLAVGDANTSAISSGNATDDPLWAHTGTFSVTTTTTPTTPLVGLTMAAETENAVDFGEFVRMTNTGATTVAASILVGDASPNGNVNALTGSLFLDAAAGAAYVNTDGATAWTDLAAGGGSGTLDSVITGGTPDNDVSIPSANPIIFRDGGVADFTVMSIITTATDTTPGHGLLISMGAQKDGDALNVTNAGDGAAIFANNTGAGNALQIQDGGSDVLAIDGAGAVAITPTTGQSFQAAAAATDLTAAVDLDGTAGASLRSTSAGTATAGDVELSSESTAAGSTAGDVLVGSFASAGTAGGLELRAGGTAFGDPNEGEINIVATDTVDVDAADVTVDTTGSISLDAVTTLNATVTGNSAGATDVDIVATNAGAGTGNVSITADDDIFFDANGAAAPIPFNASGADADLDAGFTASSIIGALNELLGGQAATTQYAGTVNGTTGVSAGEAVALMNDGGNPRVFQADANAGDQTENAVGLALAAGGTGAAVQVVVAGEVATPDAAWTGGVPATTNVGDPVFVSDTAGLITLTAPGGTSRVLKIGVVSFGGSGNVRVMVNAPDSIKL